jgi:4-amino-4-deoxy-L-arabinose transferase-like glycosyltransferase
MNGILAFLSLTLCVAIIFLSPDKGAAALLVCAVLAFCAGFVISRIKIEKSFLLKLFLSALLVRVFVGTLIYYFQLQLFFGGDALTYDDMGNALLQVWQGNSNYLQSTLEEWSVGGGWGMLYGVAFIYKIIGRNMLAVQFLNAVIGAATVPAVFLCAYHIFKNLSVARTAAYFVAFFPSLVLWSSQGLKDGPIVFFLVITIYATLKLGEQLSAKYVVFMVAALLGLLSLRFYIFYMAVAAIAGSLLIGMRQASARSLVQQLMMVIGIGLLLTYLGVLRTAGGQFERFGNLEAIQRSRSDLATSANTGFGKDVDVSTTSGALSAIPLGATYLLFAPFPWQLANLRQSITLPEMIIWWVSFPLLVLGLWFTIKHRLRQSLPILIFTTMLTLAYSVFQGNVGTAYRQRAQLLVFYFIFVAIGYVLMKEKREERRLQEQALAAKQMAMMGRRRRA